MTPFADLHCHLLAGLDDGPRTLADAVEMCRIAVAEGTRYSVALAHQSERWQVKPETILASVKELTAALGREGVPLALFPSAEVMAVPDLKDGWDTGRFLSVGDTEKYLLVEMPHQVFVDLRSVVRTFAKQGVRVVLAHPERHPELLHDAGRIDELIRIGCLVQVSSGSVTEPKDAGDLRALRSWFRRGCVHVLGSDGHSPRKRKPLMAAAAKRVREWVGAAAADRILHTNGLAVLHGESLMVPLPRPERSWWPLRLWA